MVKGAWIITVREMRCKNWVNGLEIVFRLDGNGQPAGSILPPPASFWDKLPQTLDVSTFLRRMRRQATILFYRAYYQRLLKTQCLQTAVAHSL
jgi:hypothetical protein